MCIGLSDRDPTRCCDLIIVSVMETWWKDYRKRQDLVFFAHLQEFARVPQRICFQADFPVIDLSQGIIASPADVYQKVSIKITCQSGDSISCMLNKFTCILSEGLQMWRGKEIYHEPGCYATKMRAWPIPLVVYSQNLIETDSVNTVDASLV